MRAHFINAGFVSNTGCLNASITHVPIFRTNVLKLLSEAAPRYPTTAIPQALGTFSQLLLQLIVYGGCSSRRMQGQHYLGMRRVVRILANMRQTTRGRKALSVGVHW